MKRTSWVLALAVSVFTTVASAENTGINVNSDSSSYAESNPQINNNPNANAGAQSDAIGIGTTGPIVNEQGQTLIFAPKSEAPKRFVPMPTGLSGVVNTPPLFIDTGKPANVQLGPFQRAFQKKCFGKIDRKEFFSARNNTIERDLGPVKVQIIPFLGYVNGTTSALVEHVRLETIVPIEGFSQGNNYQCLSTVNIIVEDPEALKMAGIRTITKKVLETIFYEIKGIPVIDLYIVDESFAYKVKVQTDASGYVFGPRISGYISNLLTGSILDVSGASSAGTKEATPAATFALVAKAPYHACCSDSFYVAYETKDEDSKRTATRGEVREKSEPQEVVVRVIVERK